MLEREMRAYALRNAIEHGSAVVGKVLPKLFNHGLDKKDIKKVMPELNKVISEVNKMSASEREKEFEKVKGLVKEREVKEKDLPELPNVSGKVVTRLAPEPSKYLHVGHALSFLLNYVYAKRYNGKCVLRFEDANPEKVTKEYIKSIEEDLFDYLDIKVDEKKFVSDDMNLFYDSAEKLIESGNAFMCSCDRETMQSLRHVGKECKCRKNSIEVNLDEWGKFKAGNYMNGESILRLKGDMKNNNHVLRDPVLFRAIGAKHWKHGTKYKVWPLYDFYNAIEDSIMGVTHVLRSNEFEMRTPLQNMIKKLLGLKEQTVIQYGRFGIVGGNTKGREIRELIDSGEYIGWDDPRLFTLKALRRRGIKKEVFYELVKQIGLSKYAVDIDFKMIASISRKLIDAETSRYFFVENPVKIRISGAPENTEVEIPLHPDDDRRGFRKFKTGNGFYVSSEDEPKKGSNYRLMHLFNFKDGKFISSEVDAKLKAKMIHWLPVSDEVVKVKVLMDDGRWVEGFGEDDLKKVKLNEVVQFERFGFAKLDKKGDCFEFWFLHK